MMTGLKTSPTSELKMKEKIKKVLAKFKPFTDTLYESDLNIGSYVENFVVYLTGVQVNSYNGREDKLITAYFEVYEIIDKIPIPKESSKEDPTTVKFVKIDFQTAIYLGELVIEYASHSDRVKIRCDGFNPITKFFTSYLKIIEECLILIEEFAENIYNST